MKEQEEFVKAAVKSLHEGNPGYNVLIYHNQDSRYELSSDAVHDHYELPTLLGFTKGYEIFVFTSGSFDLAGDRGPSNWDFTRGCIKHNGKHVDFGDLKIN